MPQIPPSGLLPSAPPPSRHQAVPVDAREWRIRIEMRANAVLGVAVVLLVSASWAGTVWAGWTALGSGVALLAVSVWLRPALPWRVPPVRAMDAADVAAMRPVTRPFPAARGGGAPAGVTSAVGGAPGAGVVATSRAMPSPGLYPAGPAARGR